MIKNDAKPQPLENENLEKITTAAFLRFALPSTAGLLLFLVPFQVEGELTLLLNLLIDWSSNILGSLLIPLIIAILAISAILSTAGLWRPDLLPGFWKNIFTASPMMTGVRILAVFLAVLIYFQLGPEMIWAKETGGSVLNSLLASLTPFFLWAGLLFPLLTEYGLMEFTGTLLRPIFRPVFRLPGRAAVNCALAWMGSATVGVAITDQQYEKGYYTAREAIAIGTGFTVTSIPMVVLFSKMLGLSHMFPLVYGSFVLVGFLVNIIMVRIPPISGKPDEYLHSAGAGVREEMRPADVGTLKWAVLNGIQRNQAQDQERSLLGGLKLTANIWFTVEPLILVLGTAAMVIADYTPVVHWIAFPFIYIINLLGLPEAAAAAPAMVIGFFDAFLPIIVATRITAESTKFVVLIVALVQVIFMTSVGTMLLKSKMPVNFLDLVVIFLMRTLLSLPLAALLAYLIF